MLIATKCATCGKVVVTAYGKPAPKVGEPVGEITKLKYPRWQKTVNRKASRTKKKQLITLKTYADPNAFQGWVLNIVRAAGNPKIEGLALTSAKRLPPPPNAPAFPF